MTNKELKYKTHIIAFLDVLGFREMVLEKQTEKIEQYFNISEIVKKRLQEIYVKKDIEFISFSDSIVAFLKMDTTPNTHDNLIKAREFLIALSILQGELALHNVWLRGGVSIGDLRFDDDLRSIFGPGFIKAFDLESRYAKYPRIILDQDVISFLNFNSVDELIQNINQVSGEWKNTVLFRWRIGNTQHGAFYKDYPLFIDYLGQFMNHEGYPKLESIAHLLNESSQKNPIAYEKFRWVADYLNLSYKLSRRFGPTENEISGDNLTFKLEKF